MNEKMTERTGTEAAAEQRFGVTEIGRFTAFTNYLADVDNFSEKCRSLTQNHSKITVIGTNNKISPLSIREVGKFYLVVLGQHGFSQNFTNQMM